MDDFGGKEVFFDGDSLGEEPSDDEGDASLVFPLDEQTVSLPVMDCPGVLPAVVLWEFCLLDDFLGDEIEVGRCS